MVKQNIYQIKNYDYFGVLLSFLCGVHCLITPFLIIYLPIVGETIETTWFHTGMIIFVVIAFYQSIFKNFKLHRSKLTLGLGVIGLSLFFISYINELNHHSDEHDHGKSLSDVHGDETSMIYVAIAGAVFLISAHALNIRKCRCLKKKYKE